MTAVCGISYGPNLATVDAAVGVKVPTRLYTTLDTPAPQPWLQIAAGRSAEASLKPKLAGKIVPYSDVLAHKYDNQLRAYVAWLGQCGMTRLEVDHEIDAKTAAEGGTPAQLDQMLLYVWDYAASLGWTGDLVVGLTGWDEVDRGPLFAPILDRATMVMVDSGYATAGSPKFADAAGPSVDWLAKTYPGKPIIMGEMGSTSYPGRAGWIADAGNSILTDPRFAPLVEAIWWDATTGSFDTRLSGADLTAWVAVCKASLTPPPGPGADPLQSKLDAALAEIVMLEGELAQAVVQHTTDQATIGGLQGQLTAAQLQVTKLSSMVTAARSALGS